MANRSVCSPPAANGDQACGQPASDHEVARKCEKDRSHFKHSALATEALLKKQQVSSDKPKLPKRLVQDCVTGWNSTYYILERLVSLRWKVGAVLSESGGDSSLDLSPDQWKLAEMLIPVLREEEEELEEHDMSSLRVLVATLEPRFRHISFSKDDEKRSSNLF